VSLAAPQSWNRYSYVGNGPLNSFDPLGLFRDEERYYMGGDFSSAPLDPGAAWLNSETQQFMVDAGLNSPIEQGLTRYLAQVDAGFNALQPGYTPPQDEPDSDYRITVHCGGSLSDATCQPPSQAVPGSLPFSINVLYPGLAPGDKPVGLNIWQGYSEVWQNASGAANTALIGTGVVLALPAGVGALGTAYTVTANTVGAAQAAGLSSPFVLKWLYNTAANPTNLVFSIMNWQKRLSSR
jgi:hypothetical protein